MKLIHTDHDVRQRHYVPPVLGNGSLSLMIDREGHMAQQSYCSMIPVIVRAGWRYEHPAKELISYGYFLQEIPAAGELTSFTQTLDTEKACCTCVCTYRSGLTVTTTVFCHAQKDIIAIRKEFSRSTSFSFRYTLPLKNHLQSTLSGEGDKLSYSGGSFGGKISLIAPGLEYEKVSDDTLCCRGTVQQCEILLSFEDEIPADCSWDTLFQSHCAEWAKYWGVSSIDIPDEALHKTYQMAQYHLKISSTKWSVPTGLFPSHWQGRFFAYDEFYTHGAFLTSGRFEEAEKIDRFRCSILRSAIGRTCHYTLCPVQHHAARYPWETLEDGSEGAPPGFWMDRYVHMANVAFSAWETYLFTQDAELLRTTLYPVIHACAEYHRRSAVYFDSVTGAYVGKCTDMERFGEFIERPYSTTCGIIACFRAAAECAGILNCDEELRKKWSTLAEELYKNLPQEDGQFVPYPGWTQHSIAMYHGLFPYAVIPPDEPRQLEAIRETEKNICEFAGQYFTGAQLSSWYAGVMATAAVRLGEPVKALELLQETAQNSTGCFYECFEVYEKQKLPWFTTASGAIVRALNELLIYGAEHKIDLWGGKDYAFNLPQKKYVFHAEQQKEK